MFFNLSKIGEFCITPAHVGLFLTAFGVALLFTRFARGGRMLATVGVVALFVMSFSPLGAFLALPLENRFPPPPEDLAAPDGIVVLGGAFDEYVSMMRGRISFNEAAERLTAAVGLSRHFPQARLVFTGGTAALSGSPFSEAEVAGESGRVVLEARSRNTRENALLTRNLVAPRPTERWLLVTSAMHMPRVIGVFRQVGFPVIAYPVDYQTSGRWFEWTRHKNAPAMLRLVDLAAHEWFGLFVYRLTGKTDALFPAP